MSPFQRPPVWKQIVFIVAAAVLIHLIGLLVVAHRPSPPLPDGLVPADSTYDVRILRDTYGVPHIFGKTDADAAYGLAFAHAEDDFATIQGALLAARGRLATRLGRDGAPNDYMVRLLEVQEVVDAGYPELPEDVRAICEAYADGLNHYAALHPDEAWTELYPAEGRDVVAGFVHKLPLFFGIDKVLTGLLDGTLDGLDAAQATQTASLSESSFPVPGYDEIRGSNAFALAPSKTGDGSTTLVVNSHQPWEGPVAWYEAHVRSEAGWDAVGGVFPGAPIILHGHNRRLGWAHTVNRPDLVDVFRLDISPDDENVYFLDGEPRRLEVQKVGIEVKLWRDFRWTFRREVLSSEHGPVMRTDHGTFALRFSGFGEVGQVEQWYRMNRAEDLPTWQEAMSTLSIPMFNTVYGDADGQIGYVYNARLPHRLDEAGLDYQSVLPGDRSDLIWDHEDVFAWRELPQVWSPESGWVQNCNNSPFRATDPTEDVTADDLPPIMTATGGLESRMTNRSLRALQLLGDDPEISYDELMTYKWDTAYHPDSSFARLLDRAAGLTPSEDLGGADQELLEQVQTALSAFDRETDLEDPHAALAVRAVGPFIEPPRDVADDELQASMLDAARALQEHFGSLSVPWGEVNRMRRGETDLGLAGAPDVLHAVYARPGEDGRLKGVAGDCYVLTVRWSEDGSFESESLHQYGSATLDEASPHYDDQAPLFAERRLKPVFFEESEIRANLKEEYRPGERSPESSGDAP